MEGVEDAFARRLVAFAYDLTQCAAGAGEAPARRAAVSPYSGIPALDARALCAAAGDRKTLADTVTAERVPLPHESLIAARRFVRGLATLRDAFRAQGATAREHVATVGLTFGLPGNLEPWERATFESIEAVALRYDEARPAGAPWDAGAFARELLMLASAVPPVAHATAEPAREPLPAREREAPSVVRRRRGHFSASSLNAFAECERRWYYRYVCAAVEDRGSSASFYGTAFHWALERFHEEFPRADQPREVLERKLDGYLNTAFDRYRIGFATPVEFELQRRRARRTGRRYLAWFVERSRRTPFEVIGTEEAVELELDGYRFIGYVDRLDRDDRSGGVTVVDYKTGTIAESADEYRRKVREFTDFQLPFYYWARTAAGDRVTRLSLVPLKDPSRDVAPIELEVVPVATPPSYGPATAGTIGIDELERARRKMIELAAALADGPLEAFPPTDDPDACTFCSYQNACSRRPLQCEDRFGR